VKAIRHVHVWSITSGKPVATLEIVLDAGADPAHVTQEVKEALLADYGIGHATVEIIWDADAPNCALTPAGGQLSTPLYFEAFGRSPAGPLRRS